MTSDDFNALDTWTNGCNIAVRPEGNQQGHYCSMEWDTNGSGTELTIRVKGYGLGNQFTLTADTYNIQYGPTHLASARITAQIVSGKVVASFDPGSGIGRWSLVELDDQKSPDNGEDGAWVEGYDGDRTAIIRVRLEKKSGTFKAYIPAETG